MRPDTRNTGTVAELKMKFAGNQNVKNVIGVAGMATRTPSTVTKVVCRVRSHIGGSSRTYGTTKKDVSTNVPLFYYPYKLCTYIKKTMKSEKV